MASALARVQQIGPSYAQRIFDALVKLANSDDYVIAEMVAIIRKAELHRDQLTTWSTWRAITVWDIKLLLPLFANMGLLTEQTVHANNTGYTTVRAVKLTGAKFDVQQYQQFVDSYPLTPLQT